MQAKTRTPSRILCRCLTGALGRSLTSLDLPVDAGEWENVLRLSSAHLATPQLRWALQAQGLFSQLPSDVADYLEAVYTLNLDRNQQCEEQLAQLIPLLNSVGVQPVLLKGAAAIVGGLYPTSGERMITDLDILIPTRKLPEILGKLAEVGYQVHVAKGETVPESVGFDAHHHYPALVSPDWPSSVELHVQPVLLPMVKFLPSEELFRDATPLAWRGGECLFPSRTHFILHSMVHAFLVNVQTELGRVSIRQLFEFVLASQTYAEQIDWSFVKSRFDDLGRSGALREYLALANTCFAFEVPAGINVDHRDRQRARRYLARLDSLALDLGAKTLQQVRRLRHLREHPGKLRRLLTADFYSRLVDSFKA